MPRSRGAFPFADGAARKGYTGKRYPFRFLASIILMRLPIIAIAAVGLVLSAGSASAQEILPVPPAVAPILDAAVSEKPLLKERVKGAQDQFLQHQAQVRERAAELKDNASARVESIRANVLERRETVKETVAELQNTDPSERGALMRAKSEERRLLLTEKRASFASTTQERREALLEKRGEITAARFENAIRLMNAMVLRLSGIADRIDVRIGALSLEGTDTSAAEEALEDARASITEAESAVNALSESIVEALASETPRESLEATRTDATKTKEAIRAAHAALMSAAAALPREIVEPGT